MQIRLAAILDTNDEVRACAVCTHKARSTNQSESEIYYRIIQ